MNGSCRHARGRMLVVAALTVGCVVGTAACQYAGSTPVATGTLATSPAAAGNDGSSPEAPIGSPASNAGTTDAAGMTPPNETTMTESPGSGNGETPSRTDLPPGAPGRGGPTTTLLTGGAAESVAGPPVASDPVGLPTVPPRAVWGALDTSAEAALVATRMQAFLAEVDKAHATGTVERTAVRELSQGSARAEVENSLVEMELEGYRQRGTTRVLAASVHRMNAPVQRLVVVCVDDSDVEIAADNGYVVRPKSATPRASLHEYTLLRVARDWRVLKHDMPDDPDCGPGR